MRCCLLPGNIALNCKHSHDAKWYNVTELVVTERMNRSNTNAANNNSTVAECWHTCKDRNDTSACVYDVDMETCDIYSEPKSFNYKTFEVDGVKKTAIMKVCPAGKVLNGESSMSAYVLLNSLNTLGNRVKM